MLEKIFCFFLSFFKENIMFRKVELIHRCVIDTCLEFYNEDAKVSYLIMVLRYIVKKDFKKNWFELQIMNKPSFYIFEQIIKTFLFSCLFVFVVILLKRS
jgi:hypothetical protein